MQNKILNLFDEQFVTKLFREKILKLYPDFAKIKKIKIIPHKNLVWEHTYHVVIEFEISFLTKSGKTVILPIFTTAHSSEPRKNVYDSLKFLWKSGFDKGYLTIPRPLFYSEYFKAVFYRGAEGKNLYQYIRQKNFKEIETIVPKAAQWLVKLHKTPVDKARNFNRQNSRIKTVVPGIRHIFKKIEDNHPEYSQFYRAAFKIFIDRENKFLKKTKKLWLIHGDAHPENVIKMGKKKVAVIDFTDLCLADFARDIGSFSQQIEYMCGRKIGNQKYSEKIKKLFLSNYLKNAKIKLDDSLKERINNYYNWTAMRTATFFLLKANPDPERAKPLIEQVAKNLKI
jgi:thiamine kinase-like enzyme